MKISPEIWSLISLSSWAVELWVSDTATILSGFSLCMLAVESLKRWFISLCLITIYTKRIKHKYSIFSISIMVETTQSMTVLNNFLMSIKPVFDPIFIVVISSFTHLFEKVSLASCHHHSQRWVINWFSISSYYISLSMTVNWNSFSMLTAFLGAAYAVWYSLGCLGWLSLAILLFWAKRVFEDYFLLLFWDRFACTEFRLKCALRHFYVFFL